MSYSLCVLVGNRLRFTFTIDLSWPPPPPKKTTPKNPRNKIKQKTNAYTKLDKWRSNFGWLLRILQWSKKKNIDKFWIFSWNRFHSSLIYVNFTLFKKIIVMKCYSVLLKVTFDAAPYGAQSSPLECRNFVK